MAKDRLDELVSNLRGLILVILEDIHPDLGEQGLSLSDIEGYVMKYGQKIKYLNDCGPNLKRALIKEAVVKMRKEGILSSFRVKRTKEIFYVLKRFKKAKYEIYEEY